MHASHGHEYVDSVKLPRATWEAIVDTLDRQTLGDQDARRRETRFRFAGCEIRLDIFNDKNQPTKFLVHGRNISASGLSVLHGGFVYPGSKCRLQIPMQDERICVVDGVIVNCRHVAQRLHEISINFIDKLELDRFDVTPVATADAMPDQTASSDDSVIADSADAA
ncbi:MAG: PilZ domain-containing protein [Planctomycetota bacterium]